MRVPTVFLILGATAIVGTLLGPSASEAARSTVTVKKKALSPRALSGTGGKLWVAVNVNRKGGAVTNVGVRANIPGGGGGYAVLPSAGNGRYQGYCTVSRNGNPFNVKANVVVVVTSPDGTEERRIGTVQVGPGNDSLPPPPPSN